MLVKIRSNLFYQTHVLMMQSLPDHHCYTKTTIDVIKKVDILAYNVL